MEYDQLVAIITTMLMTSGSEPANRFQVSEDPRLKDYVQTARNIIQASASGR